MATKISTEILVIILNNIQSSQDLYSSLLVNRNWCKITIPILWELPLGQECFTNNEVEKKALCIRTYISCMNTQARTSLIQNGYDLSSSPTQVTFDYPSFSHKFIINNLVNFIFSYSSKIKPQQIIGSNQNTIKNNNNNESRILFREICKLIINRCTFLDCFKLTGTSNFWKNDYDDLISSIFVLPGVPKVFEKLESFTSTLRKDVTPFRPIFESLTLICGNILTIDLFLVSDSQVILSTKLIRAQKRLENLSISVYGFQDCSPLFWAIVSQKETLKSLRLRSVCFYDFEGKSSPIGQIVSLQELYLEDCYGLHESFFASSFTQLSSFYYFHSSYPIFGYPQELIIKIIETANTNLKNVCLFLYPTITFDIFSTILNYCAKITKLALYNLTPEQVIELFDNNFDELRRFSFDCGGGIVDADELLCQMAENVPESLETIEIIMVHKDPWIFSASTVRDILKSVDHF